MEKSALELENGILKCSVSADIYFQHLKIIQKTVKPTECHDGLVECE